ncbi:hypothetical protein [Stenotrophomonas maltophilia]|uniref:hypothetical protein n=1 Tax=Stenotrophomonas maltophilia TaxID=40324 RepID=UPI0013D9E8B8|nr:hypothetical protein [Stenotrophomonas maltophilia]
MDLPDVFRSLVDANRAQVTAGRRGATAASTHATADRMASREQRQQARRLAETGAGEMARIKKVLAMRKAVPAPIIAPRAFIATLAAQGIRPMP